MQKKILYIAGLGFLATAAAHAVSLEWKRNEIAEISGINPSSYEAGHNGVKSTATSLSFQGSALLRLMKFMPRVLDLETGKFLDHLKVMEVATRDENSIQLECATKRHDENGDLAEILGGPVCTITIKDSPKAG